MSPVLAIHDFGNERWVDAKFGGDVALHNTGSCEPADLAYVLFSQLCHMMAYSAPHKFGMAVGKMVVALKGRHGSSGSPKPVPRLIVIPTGGDAIKYVVIVTAQSEMGHVDATPIVAVVQDAESFGNGSVRHDPCCAMRKPEHPLERQVAISSPKIGIGPFGAAIRRRGTDERQETSAVCVRKRKRVSDGAHGATSGGACGADADSRLSVQARDSQGHCWSDHHLGGERHTGRAPEQRCGRTADPNPAPVGAVGRLRPHLRTPSRVWSWSKWSIWSSGSQVQ